VNRTTKIALFVSGVTLVCVIGVCAAAFALGPALPSFVGCRDATKPTVSSVIDRPQRIKELYPALGAFTEVHWQERELTPRTCPDIGPMDYLMSGFVVLAPDTVAGYRSRFAWIAATPAEVPEDLRRYAPANPQWTASAAFEAEIATASSHFWLDAATGTLFFTHTTA
jgi:hypothetical protein